tara:strand:- start:317 stop:3298 length:2982 start_codon:yes stop_codon:yes gene_type:complete
MGKISELLKAYTEKQVGKAVKLEEAYYADPSSKLVIEGDEIIIQGDISVAKDISKTLKDPLKIILKEGSQENLSNYSKFLGRLKEDAAEDITSLEALVKNLEESYGKVVSKKMSVKDIVENATPKDIQDALKAAMRYNETKQMSEKHYVINLMNSINLGAEIQSLHKLVPRQQTLREKQALFKNMIIHSRILHKVTSSISEETSTSARKVAFARHGRKVQDLSFNDLFRGLARLPLDNMDAITMDQVSKLYTRFELDELIKVSEQMDEGFFQKLFDATKGGYRVVMELYYNSLLSAFPTHVVNSLGTVVHMGKDKIDNVLASGIGHVRTKVGKAMGFNPNMNDRISFRAAKHTELASLNSLREAFQLFSKIILTGEGADTVTKFDFKRQPAIKIPGTEGTDNMLDVFDQLNQGRGPEAMMNMLGILTRMPSRFLSAEDTFFKFLSKRHFLYEEALRIADTQIAQDIASGIPISQAKEQGDALIKQYMANPNKYFPMDFLDRADAHAQKITFQQPLDPVTSKISKVFRLPVLNFLAPFVKTPINVAKTTFDNSFNIFPVIDALSRGQGREFDKALAKVTTGSFIVMQFAAMASGSHGDNVVITGGPHPDYKVRKLMRDNNIPNYAIGLKQDDGSYKYTPFTRLDPISGLLAMGADYNQYASVLGADDLEAMATMMAMSAATYVGDQPFMQGVAEFNKIFMGHNKTQGEAFVEWLGGKSAEVIGTTLSITNPLGVPLGNTLLSYANKYEVPILGDLPPPTSSFYRSYERSASPEKEDTTFDYSIYERQQMGTFYKAFHDKRRQMFTKNPQYNDRYYEQRGMFNKPIGASEHIAFGYEAVFSPFRIQTSAPDDVEKEILNLALSPSDKSLALTWNVDEIDGIKLNKNQKDYFNMLWTEMDENGQISDNGRNKLYNENTNLKNSLRRVMKTTEYQNGTNEQKYTYLKNVWDIKRENAANQIRNNPQLFPELYETFENLKNIQNQNKVFKSLELLYGD